MYLKTPVLPENYTLLVLDVLQRLATKIGALASFFAVKDILGNVTAMLSSPQKQKQAAVSEDMKAASCECLGAIVSHLEADVSERLFSEEMKLPLSHLVFTVCGFVDKDKGRVSGCHE